MKQYDNSSSLSDVNTNNNNDDNVDIINSKGYQCVWIDIKTGAKRNNASGDALILWFIVRYVIIIES